MGEGRVPASVAHAAGAHNKSNVEVFALALRPHDKQDSELDRAQIEGSFEHFHNAGAMVSYQAIAEFVNRHGIHVLVDLCGLHARGEEIYE